jgi:uncharacterized protein DUF397
MATSDRRHGWYKSSFSANSGDCVEVRIMPCGEVAVRDSKDQAGPALLFTSAEWAAFLAGAQQGEFDLA